MKKSALRLPKLKIRDELLRTAPELGRFLAAGDELAGAVLSLAGPRHGSPGSKARNGSPQRMVRISDDEITEEDRVRAELERAKAERAALLASLAKLRSDAGKGGGELQQEDIRLLRREVEAKQEKLNELRQATSALEDTLAQLETTSRDCEQLMPDGEAALQARAAQLSAELAAVEQDILEAEAKHELYKLLETRTRRDHAASEQRMREQRGLQEGADDDFTTLVKQMHEMRAAKEDAERELGSVVGMYDQVRSDWGKKLRDRRKEVRELERHRAEEEKRRQQQTAMAAEKGVVERDKSDKSQSERAAVHARLSVVVPELEVLESAWARLHGMCGASNAEELIAHWTELKAKEVGMRELVRLAEAREARAKQEVATLLAERHAVFDTETARGERRQAGLGAAAGQEQAEQVQRQELCGQDGDASAEQRQGSLAEVESGEREGSAAAEDTASKSSPGSDTAGDTQGSAGSEGSVASQGAAAADNPAAVSAATTEAAVQQLLREKQLAVVEARRRKAAALEKFSKLRQVCVAADQGLRLLSSRLRAALEASASADAARRRTSRSTGPGSRRVTGLNRRTTGQHAVRRISAASLREHRSSIQILPAPDLVIPCAPAAASGTSIHDRDFFPELPSMLTDVSSRLGNLLSKIDQLEVATAAAVSEAAPAAAAQRGAASVAPDGLGEGTLLGSRGSSMAGSETSEAVTGGPSRHSPGKKLHWADGQAPAADESGTLPSAGEGAAGGKDDSSSCGVEGDASATSAEGEKALRKGFRRRTLAGPAWVDAVREGKPVGALLLRKKPGDPGRAAPGAGAATLQRILGYVEEPGSSGDEAGACGRRANNPFDLASSEEETDVAGEAVVDRQYLKHRAHKLTNPKARSKGSGAGGATSPTVHRH